MHANEGRSLETFRRAGAALLIGLLALAAFAGEGPVGRKQGEALDRALVGRWQGTVGDTDLDLRLGEDGSFKLGPEEGRYRREGKALIFTVGDEDDAQETTYRFELAAGMLTLSGDALAEPIKFGRRHEAKSLAKKLFGLTREGVADTFRRIVAILVIVLIGRAIIAALSWTSRWLVFSNWGPLRFLYRRRKNRTRTLHAIWLNVAKYVIYFTALGFILAELGVNYTTYLASLSVIGLAVAFGSQGLVQDVVTGFFIVFENQFDVGDLIEVSGQTGIVEDFGLRMTRLRNYLGEVFVIPNRNIALVGNFTLGGLKAQVDVAAADAGSARRAGEVMEQTAAQVAKQFAGVFLSPPKAAEPVELETGERFARLRADIWPGQQWVVDQQLVPRIREALQREGIEIPGDKVATFYHARRPEKGRNWKRGAA